MVGCSKTCGDCIGRRGFVRCKRKRLVIRERRRARRNGGMSKKRESPRKKATLEARPGTYAVLLSSDSDDEISVGRLGDMRLQSGVYLYVGSAFGPGGVRARVNHHLHASSRPHWHID